MPTRTDLPELADLLPVVDGVDVKTARGPVTLRARDLDRLRDALEKAPALAAVLGGSA